MSIRATIDQGYEWGLDLTLVSQDTSDIVSLENVKSFIRVDFPDDDYLISLMISSSINAIEQYCAISLRQKTFLATYDSIPKTFELPYGPVISVGSVLDSQNNLIPATSYIVTTAMYPQFQFNGYVSGQITINYTAGYGSGQVPAGIMQALMKMVSTDYDNRANFEVIRGSLIEYDNNAKSLLAPYRRKIGAF